MRSVTLHTSAYPDEPGHDTGIAHAIVQAVGAGALPETLRVHRTGDLLAFGRHDTVTPGDPAAVAAARAAGFVPIERLAGGRAAVFHRGTLAFSWAIPTPDPRTGVVERFRTIAGIIADALTSLGVPAAIGELEGEYCPGAYSVHVANRVKIMGVGQRLVRGAAHVGGVVSVTNGRRIRDVLVPVYRELGLEWAPGTAGALDDFLPGVTLERAQQAILDRFASDLALQPADIPPEMVDEGRRLAAIHISNPVPG